MAAAGLPAGVTVSDAMLRVGEQWYGLKARAPTAPSDPPKPAYPPRNLREIRPPEPAPIVPVGESSEGAWSGLFRDEFASRAAAKSWDNPPPDQTQPYFNPWFSGQALDINPGPLLDLPGADRRGQGVERAVSTGRLAAVYLNIVDCPPDVRLHWSSRTSHTAVVRLVVPLEGAP